MAGIFIFALIGLFIYGAWRLLQVAWSQFQQIRARRLAVQNIAAIEEERSRRTIQQAENDRQKQRRQMDQIKSQYRMLQIALQQMLQSPDFRRAASVAKQCAIVPAHYRRRQFRRFRPLMVRVVSLRSPVSGDDSLIAESLAELVTALGVSDFEAEYIIREAQDDKNTLGDRSANTFGTRLRNLEREHKSRLSAIDSLSPSDVAIREQLREAENNRFQEEMLGTTDSESLPNEDVSI